MRRFTFLLCLLAMSCATPRASLEAPAFDADREADAIRGVMAAQQAAWNAGDIPAFMDGYLRSDSLRFASGGTVRHGWQATLDGYLNGYPDRAAMGTLTFDLIEVRVLSSEWATVFGRWHLQREADAPSGLFTLLFRQTPDGWRIVSDHTSSADE